MSESANGTPGKGVTMPHQQQQADEAVEKDKLAPAPVVFKDLASI